MRKLQLLAAIITFNIQLPTSNCYAQALTVQWQKSYGGSADDYAYAINQTRDGGYIVAGFTASNDGDVTGNHGNHDYWVVKVDIAGNLQWQKTYGGSGVDEAYAVQQTTDGGYIVAGGSHSNDGDITDHHGTTAADYWVLKLDSMGDVQWKKSYGGTAEDIAYTVQQTKDGGYIIGGSAYSNNGDVTGHYFQSDCWVVKTDSAGTIQWEQSYGGSGGDWATAIEQTPDGGYIMTGGTASNDGNVSGNHGGYYDYWVVKLNATGVIKWQKCYGGSGLDYASSVHPTFDGGYILAGQSYSINGNVTGHHGDTTAPDYWVVKLNAAGNLLWEKSLGGSNLDEAYSIQQIADSGYVVAGYAWSNDGDLTYNHGSGDYWIATLDAAGNLKAQQVFGGVSSDWAQSIILTKDGGYMVAGYSQSDNGAVTGNHGKYDYWLLKLYPGIPTGVGELIPSASGGSLMLPYSQSGWEVYPNPAADDITIKSSSALLNTAYAITDLTGRTILSGNLFKASNTINISQLANGIYILQAGAPSQPSPKGKGVMQAFKIIKE